jgi:thymidylate synthase (FAD)
MNPDLSKSASDASVLEAQQAPERLTRPSVSALDAILGQPFQVLDDGFVRLLDYMGDDAAVVQAARVSYGSGTKRVHEDRGLIRYLMRHSHTTPFEMCEIKLHVRVPMDAWRQWIRHRMACLAEGTRIYFDLPRGASNDRGRRCYPVPIETLYERFQPTCNTQRRDKQRNPYSRRDRIRQMRLRQMHEETAAIQHTRVVDVYRNGVKPVFRVTLADGKAIEATADHRFLFSDGWSTLAAMTGLTLQNGLASYRTGDYFLYVNGTSIAGPALHQDREWLNEQYNVLGRKIADIADDTGVSYHAVRKWLRRHGVQHAKGGRCKEPWNKGCTYMLGLRELTPEWREANRKARAGAASNFWRGGMSVDRESIGRWTTQAAHRIQARNHWTCQLCCQRARELHAHHVVPVWADVTRARDEDNLTTLCGECHRRIHGRELEFVERLGGPPVLAEWRKQPRVAWNKLTTGKLVRIECIEYVGEKMTYDLEVEGPYHNFVANGIITHNSVNEYSTRYSVAIDAAQRTPSDEWRRQSMVNRQGSSGNLPTDLGEGLSAAEQELQEKARAVYEARIVAGVAREQARKDLPLSTYTEAYWKIDLHNLLHFLHLRMDEHAQQEIRAYAIVIGEKIVAQWVPIVWEAFLDYRQHAVQLSRLEAEIIGALNSQDPEHARHLATRYGLLNRRKDGSLAPNRERTELEAKLRIFGLTSPWNQAQ